jgi:alpha-tubulin suppressor-like RCC1 family protein
MKTIGKWFGLLAMFCMLATMACGDAHEYEQESVGEHAEALGPVTVGYTYDSSNNFVVTVTDATATSAELFCGATSQGVDSSAPFQWTVSAATCNNTALNGRVYNGGSSITYPSTTHVLSTPVLSVGTGTSCFSFQGRAYCVGKGAYGALGNGGTTDTNAPVQVGTRNDIKQIGIHYRGGCYDSLINGVWCWGRNTYGITGLDPSVSNQSTTPQYISTGSLLNGTKTLAVGDYHACTIRTANNEVWCWGKGGEGQLGNGSTSNSYTPVGPILSSVAKIAAGGDTTCAIKSNGDLYCWGRDDWGQVGNGGSASASVTTPQLLLPSVIDVAVGYRHTCAYNNLGDVLCWGMNDKGQLMTGSKDTLTHVSPVTAAYSGGIGGVFSGRNLNSCIKQGSSIKCVGDNSVGEMGNNTTSAYELVTKTPTGFTSSVASYSIGGGNAMGFRAGHLYAWGDNTYGQLGDPSLGWTPPQLTPNLVPGF